MKHPDTSCDWGLVTNQSLRRCHSIGPLAHSGGEAVKSLVLKRSVVVAGHKTSVCLEEEFWKSVKEIAGERNMTVTELVGEIDVNRQHANLSSAIRLFVIGVYRDQIDLAKAGTRETLVKPIAVVR
jgi:predicted DNA-binding ribbon-helix-helix protein